VKSRPRGNLIEETIRDSMIERILVSAAARTPPQVAMTTAYPSIVGAEVLVGAPILVATRVA